MNQVSRTISSIPINKRIDLFFDVYNRSFFIHTIVSCVVFYPTSMILYWLSGIVILTTYVSCMTTGLVVWLIALRCLERRVEDKRYLYTLTSVCAHWGALLGVWISLLAVFGRHDGWMIEPIHGFWVLLVFTSLTLTPLVAWIVCRGE
jgi:hypothetical protein